MTGLVSSMPASCTFMSGFTRDCLPSPRWLDPDENLYAVTGLCCHWFCCVHLYRSQPAKAIRFEAVRDREELIGNLLGNLACLAVANHDPVNRADWRDLGSRAREEHLVGDVQHFAGHGLLGDSQPEMACNGQHAIARDSGERRV